MKIAILSCFYPYRGGIAQFNANLFEELGREHDVRAFNFRRQYPDLLFPGKTQYVSPEDEAVPIEAPALLDTADPFSWGRTAREIRRWAPDLLIVRYWMSWFAPSLGYVARHMAPGCKVIGILDNVIPHERHWFDAPLTRRFLRGLDGAVTLCGEVSRDLLALRGDIPHTVLPHPIYTHFGPRLPREEAERLLGLPAGRRTLLFFGLIREYKGLDILLRAFDLLDERYQLVIAGEPYGSFDKYRRLIDWGRAPADVHVFPDYIRDSEVKRFSARCPTTSACRWWSPTWAVSKRRSAAAARELSARRVRPRASRKRSAVISTMPDCARAWRRASRRKKRGSPGAILPMI